MRPGIISEAVALHIEKVSPVVRQYIMAEGYGRAKLLTSGSRKKRERERGREREREREKGSRNKIYSLIVFF
jgi:hypothetical protein